MAWQNFAQFDLYNETVAHEADFWTVVGDDGLPACVKPPCAYVAFSDSSLMERPTNCTAPPSIKASNLLQSLPS